MFNTILEYRYINRQEVQKYGQLVKEHKLTFSCKGHKYIVNVEEYPCNLFALKYYLHNHRFSENKYKLLTGYNSPGPVIRTCVQVMLDFYQRKKNASFLIVGESRIMEEENDTKRFKVYSQLMENLFSPVSFWHYKYTEKSVYLLLNKLQSANVLYEIENLVKSVL